MPSPEKSYSAEGYRVFTKGPVPEIEEDLSKRSRIDPSLNWTTTGIHKTCQKKTQISADTD